MNSMVKRKALNTMIIKINVRDLYFLLAGILLAHQPVIHFIFKVRSSKAESLGTEFKGQSWRCHELKSIFFVNKNSKKLLMVPGALLMICMLCDFIIHC